MTPQPTILKHISVTKTILFTVESNCTFTDCYRNEHCIVTDDSDEVCICNDGYVFNVNNYECEREL